MKSLIKFFFFFFFFLFLFYFFFKEKKNKYINKLYILINYLEKTEKHIPKRKTETKILTEYTKV